jgi:hypothetical protein
MSQTFRETGFELVGRKAVLFSLLEVIYKENPSLPLKRGVREDSHRSRQCKPLKFTL